MKNFSVKYVEAGKDIVYLGKHGYLTNNNFERKIFKNISSFEKFKKHISKLDIENKIQMFEREVS